MKIHNYSFLQMGYKIALILCAVAIATVTCDKYRTSSYNEILNGIDQYADQQGRDVVTEDQVLEELETRLANHQGGTILFDGRYASAVK